MTTEQWLNMPMRTVGPIRFVGPTLSGDIRVPMATFETPLWPSTARGARVTRASEGLSTAVMQDTMTRSILCEVNKLTDLERILPQLQAELTNCQAIVQATGRFVRLEHIHYEPLGRLLYARLMMQTGDASGHNMVTKAADAVLNYLLGRFSELRYVSVSGNYCLDKKTSAINGILGRGKRVSAEMLVTGSVCEKVLKTTPQKIVELNYKKNLLGSLLSGSIRTANAHFANMLLACYLATGQDGANVVEGSQGIVQAECHGSDLYFAVTLPNIIVGTVGNGKNAASIRDNLQQMGCLEARAIGDNARRLSAIIAGAVWCGELSLLAALTNSGELVKSHLRLERSSAST